MKRGIIIPTLVILTVFLISVVSAEIILTKELESFYNLGDIVDMPVKITSLNNLKGFFTISLICNGQEIEIHKQYVMLSTGEEKEIKPLIPLIRSFIGRSTGTCTIKSSLGEEYVLSNEFKISNLIIVKPKTEKTEFLPEQSLIIEGDAKKENGKPVEGFIEATLTNEAGETTEVFNTVSNGYFYLNYTFPKEAKAGAYSVRLNIYEKDFEGNITNSGSAFYEISVKQIPTNLEILFETNEVEPGTNLKVKAVLHDQTGESMESNAILTIKDNDNKILEQVTQTTDDFLKYPIAYNQAPSEWKVVAASNKITSEATFKIIEKESAKIEVINKTLVITNAGNIPYNKEILVRMGNKTLSLNVSLELDEDQEYLLTAPDGEYTIEIIADGESQINESITLTGKTIDVKKASSQVITLVRYPLAWIFIIAVLGFVAFTIFRKGYKRSFIGYIKKKKSDVKEKQTNIREIPLRKNSLVKTSNRAELSLSIKGEKQNVSLICLKIKNLGEIQSKKGNAEEAIQKLVDLAEEEKAVVYENQNNLFFIFAPAKTKTFKNEKPAVELAQKLESALKEHNKLFKQKIDFGISLNYGSIVAKQDKNSFKFMSMGTLITGAKKISSLAKNEVLLSEKINERLRSYVKTEKHTKNNVHVFSVKEIKHQKEETKKFISDFIKKLEGNRGASL